VLISALVIGLVTAYYFGFRVGGIAAAVAGLLFLAAFVMPGRALAIYGLVGVGFFGVLVAGPRYGRKGARADFLRIARRGIARVWKLRR
jgi:hypothetical protein